MGKKVIIGVVAAAFAIGAVTLAFVDYTPGSATDGRDAAQQASAPEGQQGADISSLDLPDVVVEVNGHKVTDETFRRILEGIAGQMAAQGHQLTMERLKSMQDSVVQNIVNTELLVGAAEAKGVAVDKQRVEEEYGKVRENFGTDEALETELEAQGLDPEWLRDEIRRSMLIKELLAKHVYTGMEVSEDEAHKYYDMNHHMFKRPEMVKSRHILVEVAPDADKATEEKAHKKIEEIKKEVEGGVPFEEAAKKYSEGPSAKQGGDLGFSPKGRMVPEFEQAIFGMKPGDPGQVVRTQFGFHYVETTGHRDAAMEPYEKVKDRIKAKLSAQKRSQQLESFLEDLRAKADIKVHL